MHLAVAQARVVVVVGVARHLLVEAHHLLSVVVAQLIHRRLEHLVARLAHLAGRLVHLVGRLVHLAGRLAHLDGRLAHLVGILVHLAGKLARNLSLTENAPVIKQRSHLICELYFATPMCTLCTF